VSDDETEPLAVFVLLLEHRPALMGHEQIVHVVRVLGDYLQMTSETIE